jgi:hypothetical protein
VTVAAVGPPSRRHFRAFAHSPWASSL